MAQRLTDQVVGAVHEPALAALLLGKSAQASEHGIDFVVGDDVVVPDGIAPARDLVTIVGNLVDNAFDAVATVEGEKVVRFDAGVHEGYAVLTVSDTGPGVPRPDPCRRSGGAGPPRTTWAARPAAGASAWRWWRSRSSGSAARRGRRATGGPVHRPAAGAGRRP